ncbi:TPA: hypothetical protein ACX6Q0_003816 [Photobacterium damselae]
MNNKNDVTTFIYRHKNYKSKAQIKRTLQHSLRIENTEYSSLEWNPNLTPVRALLLKPDVDENGKHKLSVTKMDDESLNEREHILNTMIDELFPLEASTKDKQDLTKYKAKLKKKIKETDLDEQLHEILCDVLDNPSDSDFTNRINNLSNIKRKKQLLGMLTKYHELHDLCKCSSDKRASKLHESFFKIPSHNGAVLTPNDIVNTLRSFYKKIAPQHEIKLTVFHDDERLETTAANTGAHVHVFLSIKNNVTQKYDLNKTLKQYVNNYLQTNPINFVDDATDEIVKINSLNNTYRDSQIYGSVMQDLFFNHLKEKKPNINFGFTDDRLNRFNQRVDKYVDAKKRKSDRKFNYFNAVQKRVVKINKQLKQLEENKKEIVYDITETALNISDHAITYMIADTFSDSISETKAAKERLIGAVDNAIAEKKLDVGVFNKILEIIKKVSDKLSASFTNVSDVITSRINKKFNKINTLHLK